MSKWRRLVVYPRGLSLYLQVKLFFSPQSTNVPQLKLVSLWLAHRLPHNYDDDDEDGQEDKNAANRYRHHCTIAHPPTIAANKNKWESH
ncbi:hypothetical protein DMENIID0001_032700 [Sergentomyia squamirostris]